MKDEAMNDLAMNDNREIGKSENRIYDETMKDEG